MGFLQPLAWSTKISELGVESALELGWARGWLRGGSWNTAPLVRGGFPRRRHAKPVTIARPGARQFNGTSWRLSTRSTPRTASRFESTKCHQYMPNYIQTLRKGPCHVGVVIEPVGRVAPEHHVEIHNHDHAFHSHGFVRVAKTLTERVRGGPNKKSVVEPTRSPTATDGGSTHFAAAVLCMVKMLSNGSGGGPNKKSVVEPIRAPTTTHHSKARVRLLDDVS
jgi:hypothetical protein